VYYAAVMFKNQVLVCGGSINNNFDTFTDSIEVLDLNGNPLEWREFSVNLPIKMAGQKCVVYGNRLLIIGCCTEEDENMAIYELLLVPPYSSKLLCHMKKKRALAGVELFGDKILIAGGQEAETDVEIFDITRNECVEMLPLPHPVHGMATVRRGDTMLLIGGTGEQRKASNEMIEYDFKTGQSKVEVVMKTERVACAAFIHGNILVIIGGSNELPIDHVFDEVECFKFSSRSWKKLSPMIRGKMSCFWSYCKKRQF
jgi:hypothetical protein